MWFWRQEAEVLSVWLWTLVALATSGFLISAVVKKYLLPRVSIRYQTVPKSLSRRAEEALDGPLGTGPRASGIVDYPGEDGLLRLVESWKNSPQCPESDQQLLSAVMALLKRETKANKELAEQA